ncbi:MAG: 3-hydroxyacyl-CoA dehydrogenase [Pseudomonadota bacterium]
MKVACIGAGLVGRAWAVVFARAGHDVALYDRDRSVLDEQALPGVKETLALLAAHGLLEGDVSSVLARITVPDNLAAAVDGAGYVQESIREDLETKRAAFRDIADHAPRSCILASSTSAIKGSDFLCDIEHPERALVAHPVNPPSLIPLVELCATDKTSESTVQEAHRLLETAGMRPITVRKEIDGFILNRLQYTLVAEAMHLVGEGYCTPEDVDRVMTDGLALRWASIGPFETAHLNASGGFADYVTKLGPMMKHMGRSARPDYDWNEVQAQAIHTAMSQRTPVTDLPARQTWRDEQILKVRKLQKAD